MMTPRILRSTHFMEILKEIRDTPELIVTQVYMPSGKPNRQRYSTLHYCIDHGLVQVTRRTVPLNNRKFLTLTSKGEEVLGHLVALCDLLGDDGKGAVE